MTPKTFFFLLFSLTALLFTARAQGRAPHGLAYENPVAFSPSAVEFFHPKSQEPDTKGPCSVSSNCSPLPLAAQVEAAKSQESEVAAAAAAAQKGGGRQLGAGGIVGIVFGVTFAVVLAMGAYNVLVTRQTNTNRASNSVQPDA